MMQLIYLSNDIVLSYTCKKNTVDSHGHMPTGYGIKVLRYVQHKSNVAHGCVFHFITNNLI